MTFKREGRSSVLSVCIAVLAAIMVFGLCSFSEAADATASGIISARAVDETSILLSMPYTGDDNGNNTYTVQYKPCTEGAYTPWITNAPHTSSPYKTTITGLATNTCYDIKTTYNDTDGVSGAVTQTIRITSTWDNTLLHNVNRFPGPGSGQRREAGDCPGQSTARSIARPATRRGQPISRGYQATSLPQTVQRSFRGRQGVWG